MTNRQYCQLAHEYNPKKHFVSGQFVSEKLDGQRAIWDGGISRGLWKDEVPYANLYKDERFVNRQKATGLWTRYGNVVHAPDWFLNQLPETPLDMELYAGRGRFQFVQSVVRDLVPDDADWAQIQGVVLDSPPITVLMADGTINERNCKVTLKGCLDWWSERAKGNYVFTSAHTFEQRYRGLAKIVGVDRSFIRLHNQDVLPFKPAEVAEYLSDELAALESLDPPGEGLIIKKRINLYTCTRSHDVIKVKPSKDAEATVIGYYWGEEADNTRSVSGEATGKYLGKMGSLYVEWNGVKFKLSGFTDAERVIVDGPNPGSNAVLSASRVGRDFPGEIVADCFTNPMFPRGSQVTFKYRELSDDGKPKEARYFRRAM